MIPGFVGQADGVSGESAGQQTATELLRRGQAAARRGEETRAQRLLRAALLADPTSVEARLWLAAVTADPQESVQLLTEILQEHPENVRAAEGLRWAYDRLEAMAAPAVAARVPVRIEPPVGRPATKSVPSRQIPLPIVVITCCLLVVLVGTLAIAGQTWAEGQSAGATPVVAVATHSTAALVTVAPSATATPPDPTTSPTDEPTATLPPTASPTPTVPPTATPTATPLPPTRTPTRPAASATPLPQRVPTSKWAPVLAPGDGGKWIEVILSTQTVIAWEDQTPVRRMVASTGKAGTPTVTGTYRIYQKLLRTPMSGPGYYLPNVPHTMYFYRGYAIHGAYWHNRFGTPTSHGCVNLKLADAAWLFAWTGPRLPAGAASVYASAGNPGTLVVIHR